MLLTTGRNRVDPPAPTKEDEGVLSPKGYVRFVLGVPASLLQLEERSGLNPLQSVFESQERYQVLVAQEKRQSFQKRSSIGANPIENTSPVSSIDRATVFETVNMGANPVRGTK